MYRRRRSAGLSLGVLIIIGALAGVIYLIFDSFSSGGQAGPSARPTPVSNPVAAAESVPQEAAANPVPDLQPDIPAGTRILVPSAGIYASIVRVYLDGHSWDVSRLGTNVGHLQGTAWVTEPGNVVLSGHVELADGRRGIFANLGEVSPGDLVVIEQGGQSWRYVVREVKITAPEDLGPIYPSGENILTLITCASYDFFQDAYTVRVVVVAERILSPVIGG